LVPQQLVATVQGDRHYFHAVWRTARNHDGTASWFDRAATLRTSAERARAQGWRMAQLVPVEWNDNVYFHTVWRQGGGDTSWSIFDSATSMGATSDSFRHAGWSPESIEVTGRGASARYHVLWRAGTGGCSWRWGDTQETLRQNLVANGEAGRGLTWLRSYPDGDTARRFVSIFCQSR